MDVSDVLLLRNELHFLPHFFFSHIVFALNGNFTDFTHQNQSSINGECSDIRLKMLDSECKLQIVCI